MQWWSLNDLYSVLPQYDLERLFNGEIIVGNAVYTEIRDYCDRAQKLVAELLGSRAPLEGETVPATVIECVVCTAAYQISFRSDLPDLTDKLARRVKESKDLLKSIRDRSAAPRECESVVRVIAPPRRFSLEQ